MDAARAKATQRAGAQLGFVLRGPLGCGASGGDGDGLNDGDAEGEGLGVGETMGDTPLIPPVLFDTGTIGFLLEGPEAEVEVALTGTVEVAGV